MAGRGNREGKARQGQCSSLSRMGENQKAQGRQQQDSAFMIKASFQWPLGMRVEGAERWWTRRGGCLDGKKELILWRDFESGRLRR